MDSFRLAYVLRTKLHGKVGDVPVRLHPHTSKKLPVTDNGKVSNNGRKARGPQTHTMASCNCFEVAVVVVVVVYTPFTYYLFVTLVHRSHVHSAVIKLVHVYTMIIRRTRSPHDHSHDVVSRVRYVRTSSTYLRMRQHVSQLSV